VLRLELFLGGALGVVLLAALGVVQWLLERRGGRRRTRADLLVARVAFTLLGLGVTCFLYGELIEADWLEVTHVHLQSSKLAPGTQLTIAHVSDLHVEGRTRALMALNEALAAAHPDLIIFTGDSLNRRDAAELFRRTMASWSSRLGRGAVRGNHDVYRWGNVDLFGGGVASELLSDAPLLLEHGTVALCGAPFGAPSEVERCLAAAPPQALTILAYHSPDLIEDLVHRPDLYLAGHTHGGQVRLPFYGALLTFSRYDKKYEMGRYDVNGTLLYVNRGIGFEPTLPHMRFLARPELTLLHVTPR
jgi:predicted MPP superfamily phosphohydrolase